MIFFLINAVVSARQIFPVSISRIHRHLGRNDDNDVFLLSGSCWERRSQVKSSCSCPDGDPSCIFLANFGLQEGRLFSVSSWEGFSCVTHFLACILWNLTVAEHTQRDINVTQKHRHTHKQVADITDGERERNSAKEHKGKMGNRIHISRNGEESTLYSKERKKRVVFTSTTQHYTQQVAGYGSKAWIGKVGDITP